MSVYRDIGRELRRFTPLCIIIGFSHFAAQAIL
jgi:hypothetical protein